MSGFERGSLLLLCRSSIEKESEREKSGKSREREAEESGGTFSSSLSLFSISSPLRPSEFFG